MKDERRAQVQGCEQIRQRFSVMASPIFVYRLYPAAIDFRRLAPCVLFQPVCRLRESLVEIRLAVLEKSSFKDV